MKRLFYIFSAVVLLGGCSTFDEPDQLAQGGGSKSDLPQELYVGFDEEKTEESRTFLRMDGKNVYWHSGDAIAYFAQTFRAQYRYNGLDGETSAKMDLEGQQTSQSRIVYTHALYPYDANASCLHVNNVDQISTTFSAEQQYGVNSFGKGANVMVAVGETPYGADQNLYFRSVCGFFVVRLYGIGVKVKSLKLTALGGEKIAGPATIVAAGKTAPVVTMSNEGGSEVTLDCYNKGDYVTLSSYADHPTEFWFALPPTTLAGGVKIVVTDVDGRIFEKQTTKSIQIQRNIVQPMAALKFVQVTPRDNELFYFCTEERTTPLEFYSGENPFDATIVKHYYYADNKCFVVEFDAPLKVIKEKAFFDNASVNSKMNGFRNIIFPKTLTTIEDEAFSNTYISKLVFPGTLTYIGDGAFESCDNLQSVTFEPSPTNEPLTIGSATTGALGENTIGPFAASPLREINVNRNFIQLNKPTSSDEGVFSGYNGYAYTTTVKIGEHVTEIPNYMFGGQRIVEFEIPDHITKVGVGAFSDCSKLTSITIPASVEMVDWDAFYDCSALHTVRIEDSTQPLKIACSYGSIFGTDELGPFYYSPLKEIYFGREIDYRKHDGTALTAGNWAEGVFANKHYDVSTLETTLTISDNVKTITKWMFSGVRMQTVTIPASVTKIEDSAFNDCRVLTKVICKSATPPTLGTSVFDECDMFGNGQILVPSSSLTAYKGAPNWSAYASKMVGY